MNCLFNDNIESFVKSNSDDLLSLLNTNFRDIYGEYPDISQRKAWYSSIEYLKEVFKEIRNCDIKMVFEYRLPFGNERVDLMVFGKGKKERPTIILFELKGWEKAKSCNSEFFVESDIGKTTHPEYQVKNYIGKIKFSHSESENFDIVPVVLMYNANENDVKINFGDTKVFFKNDKQELINFINSQLISAVDEDIVNKFINGEYKQNKRLFDAIKENYLEIKEQSYIALAENGWGLSSEQLDLINEIMADLEDKETNHVYFVQGAPGSGKTLVAIHLLLSGLNNGYQTILAYRNNRLINSIRNIFDSIEQGLSNTIKFYSVGPPRFNGIAEKNFVGKNLDLLIFDEAQRMTKENIGYGMKRAKVTVFFYDEGQILNMEEEGFTSNFKYEAQKQNKIIKERFLKGFYRVQGGEQYHNFVETLLTAPNNISESIINPWKDNYEFRVYNDINDLLSMLEKKKRENFKVALIASFTESPGDSKNPKSIKNLRIGYPLYSGFDYYREFNKKIYWLMDPHNDYVPFWVKGESNRLDKCASIYGCQGFETDFAGIIWGRDFVYRDGNWHLGENSEDNIGRPSLKELIIRAKSRDIEAKKHSFILLMNRYRIFLTRGIKGTYIFCEDKDTSDFLKRIDNRFLA